MAQILVRGLDDRVKAQLKTRARARGRSLEAEARDILTAAAEAALRAPPGSEEGIGTRIANRFEAVGFPSDIPELRGFSAVPFEFDE